MPRTENAHYEKEFVVLADFFFSALLHTSSSSQWLNVKLFKLIILKFKTPGLSIKLWSVAPKTEFSGVSAS